jgi:hypothetical protein
MSFIRRLRTMRRHFRFAFSGPAIPIVVRYFSVLCVLAAALERAYISLMRRLVPLSFPLVLFAWLCFGTPLVHAQTPSGSATCPVLTSKPKDDAGKGAETEAGPKVVVDELTFDTPIHLPYSDLEPEVDKLNQLERVDDPKHEWLNEFLEVVIRRAWQDQGYFKVEPSGQAVPRAADATYQHFSVILHVHEGPQYRLGAIHFVAASDSSFTDSQVAPVPGPNDSGSKPALPKRNKVSDLEGYDPPVFPVEELRSLFPIQDGEIFNVEKIRDGLDAMMKLYRAHGYIDFAPTPETEVDDVNQVVNIKMVLDEQLQYHIRSIAVEGLERGTQSALLWKIHPGDVFNRELLEQFFEDNKSILPEDSSQRNAELRRNPKYGFVDITLRFSRSQQCPD